MGGLDAVRLSRFKRHSKEDMGEDNDSDSPVYAGQF